MHTRNNLGIPTIPFMIKKKDKRQELIYKDFALSGFETDDAKECLE